MTDRKKPGVAFWATVAVVAVLAGYPLSCGPLHCIATANYDSLPEWAANAFGSYFIPLVWIGEHGPEWMQVAISRYLVFWLN